MNPVINLRSFVNFLGRNKLYTIINIFGFAASLMFVVMIQLYIGHELSVDAFHEKKDRIYRLEDTKGFGSAAPVAIQLKERYPEIESFVRLDGGFNQETNTPQAGKVILSAYAADSSFFSVFSFRFIEGTPQGAMLGRNEIVITESAAGKLFMGESALGKTLHINPLNDDFIISGVIEDFRNTHLAYKDMIMPIGMVPLIWGDPDALLSYNDNNWATYILTKPGADLSSKIPEIEDYFVNGLKLHKFSDGQAARITFTPLKDLYFSRLFNHWTVNISYSYLLTLGLVALLVLLFAVINYINLSVAQAGFRAKEASMKRLLGGTRIQLFLNFITESVILCALSLIVALFFAYLAGTWFQDVMNTNVSVADLFTFKNTAILIAGIILLGVISGIVPALMIMRFSPLDVMRGTLRRKTKMVYSKVLIGLQYCITIVLIGCTVTIVRQTQLMRNIDLGFDKDHIISATAFYLGNRSQQDAFRDELLTIPGVNRVSLTNSYPAVNFIDNIMFEDNADIRHNIMIFRADSAFIPMLDIEILHETGVADANAVWLNETAWKALGLEDGTTEYHSKNGWNRKIRGKVRDFHYSDLSKPIGEAMIEPLPNWGGRGRHILIAVSPVDAFTTMDRIKEAFNKFAGGILFDGKFLDQQVAGMYEKQNQMSRIMSSLSLLAIIISSMGMLAMATYFSRQRAQAVAVRKVFGALTSEVLADLMFNFLKLVLVAFIIAIPVIWYLMSRWLTEYAYRISLSWTIFAIAGMSALVIAGIMVFWQSYKAANANPVVSLKNN